LLKVAFYTIYFLTRNGTEYNSALAPVCYISAPAGALKNIADALGVSADVLLSDDKIMIKDKELLKRFEVVQEMTGDDKNIVLKFLDLTIRDFKTKKAYS
jgi:hypothetical protein